MRIIPHFTPHRLWLSLLGAILCAPGVSPADELSDELRGLVPEAWATETEAPTVAWWLVLDPTGGLEALVFRAMANNVDVVTASLSTEQALARQGRSRGDLLPIISADAGPSYGLANSAVSDEPLTSASARLNASVPLSPWSSLPGLASARADTRGARAREDSTRASIATLTATLWYEVALAQAQFALVETQVKRDQDLLALVVSRFRTGDATTVDVLQQQQQLAATRTTLPSARVKLLTTRRDLASLLGDSVAAPESEMPLLDLDKPGFPQPTEVISSLPEVRIEQESAASARHSATAARMAFAPGLAMTGSAGLSATDLTDPTFSQNWSVGLNLSVPLYSAGRSMAGVREARSGDLIARRALTQAVLDAVFDVETALAVEVQRRGEFLATQAQERAAQATTEASIRQYEAGLSTWTTVLSALAMEQTAELSLLSARRNHMTAWLDVQQQASGSWLDDLERP